MRPALTTALLALAITGMATPAQAAKPQPPTLEQLCPGYVLVEYGDPRFDEQLPCDFFNDRVESFAEGSGSYEGYYDDRGIRVRVVNKRYLVAQQYGNDAAAITYFGTSGGSTYTINACVDGQRQDIRVNRKTFLATVERYESNRSFFVENYDPAKDRGDFTAISVINPDYDEDTGGSFTCP